MSLSAGVFTAQYGPPVGTNSLKLNTNAKLGGARGTRNGRGRRVCREQQLTEWGASVTLKKEPSRCTARWPM